MENNEMPASQVTLSDEQANAVEWLCSFPRPVQTLGGYAGTGKTTVIRTLTDHLPSFAVCAYTGKAANVLRRKGVAGASTIHILIFSPREEEWRDERGRIHVKMVFDLKEPSEVDATGFIVDEASMVNRELHDALLTFDRPIIYVGDHGQLPPVGGADFNLMSNPDVTLEEVHRNAGEIARFAEFIRKGHSAGDWQQQPDCTGERVRLNTLDEMMEELKGVPEPKPPIPDADEVVLVREVVVPGGDEGRAQLAAMEL
jgi:exodeoxyribonuclease-5